VEFTNASTGDFDTLSWDFGDGSPTSNESNPTHIFSTGGVFTVTLTASGVGGEDTQTHTITVYQPVQADFVADSTSGTLPFPVQFQNQSTGDYETVVWDFGDGTPTSTDENPTHIFTKPGIFTVTLTISGLGGTDIETKAGYITGLSHFIFLPIVIR
jgi:PKD repeat protein